MKKKWKKNLNWIIPVGILILVLLWVGFSFNSLVSKEEEVNNKWANVESAYQRRADLIPNLVETVKGYASHEESVFTEITEARSRWQTANTPQEQVAAANKIESALARLMVVVENYPDLKASQNFLDLQSQLEGTENRINVARDRYNGAVKEYNIKVRRIPTRFVASLFGFEQRDFFEAVEGAETSPEVSFE